MFESNNGTINLSEFLTIFSLKPNSQYTDVDVKNSFRLLSNEYGEEGVIKLERVKDILKEMGMSDEEVETLTTELNDIAVKKNNEYYIEIDKFVRSPE